MRLRSEERKNALFVKHVSVLKRRALNVTEGNLLTHSVLKAYETAGANTGNLRRPRLRTRKRLSVTLFFYRSLEQRSLQRATTFSGHLTGHATLCHMLLQIMSTPANSLHLYVACTKNRRSGLAHLSLQPPSC